MNKFEKGDIVRRKSDQQSGIAATSENREKLIFVQFGDEIVRLSTDEIEHETDSTKFKRGDRVRDLRLDRKFGSIVEVDDGDPRWAAINVRLDGDETTVIRTADELELVDGFSYPEPQRSPLISVLERIAVALEAIAAKLK